MRVSRRNAWYDWGDISGFDLKSAGIYEWRIAGIGLYVGKTKGPLRSRIRAYPNNLRKMLAGLPWRKSSDRPFRPIHIALREGYEGHAAVTVSILENCHSEICNERERHWIELRLREEALGGMKVLNRT